MCLLNAFCTTCVKSAKQQQNINNSYHYHMTTWKAAILTCQNLVCNCSSLQSLTARRAWRRVVEILLSFSFNCLGNFCKRVKIRTVCKEELYLELKLKPVDKALLWTKIKKSRIFVFGKKPRVPSSGAAIPKYSFKKVFITTSNS